jgi:hypothetical protein
MLRLTDLVTAIRRRGGTVLVSAGVKSSVQGFVDERSTTHVAGWMRDLRNPDARLAYEIVLDLPEAPRVVASGIADQPDPALKELGIGDARYGFRVEFPAPLTGHERDHLIVRPLPTGSPLTLAPQLQGYVDERSTHHVAGWVRNRSDPAERVAFEVVLPVPDGERVLAHGTADAFNPPLAQLSIGDAHYGFWVLFPQPLNEEERDRVIVRPLGSRTPLELAPALRTGFEPVSHVAMDIVNNCNLRCPFCVFDYANTRSTRFMSRATFDAALRLIPFVTDGNFWLSCLHEATLHPALVQFIDSVPREWRHKIMYTTNLAKRMPDGYFAMLANSGLHHVNISLESLDPPLYERMRKGARWKIFASNWDRLLTAMRQGSAPPRLRYNIMAYRSNLLEIPGLVRRLLTECLAWQVEVRYTYDMPHIPDDFGATEYLGAGDWTWLADQLREWPAERVLLLAPPPESPAALATDMPADTGSTAPAEVLRGIPRPLNIRMEWDGKLIVYGEWIGPNGQRQHENFLMTNIHHVRDPRNFLASL